MLNHAFSGGFPLIFAFQESFLILLPLIREDYLRLILLNPMFVHQGVEADFLVYQRQVEEQYSAVERLWE